jgi:hypothetical protein
MIIMAKQTYPENTNGIERTIRGPVRLDHAEHTMELPAHKENDEEMMRVPEALKMSATAFLNGKKYHNAKTGSHDPSSHSRSGSEIGSEECNYDLTSVLCIGICQCKSGEVNHVGDDMDTSPENHGPRRSFVECDVLVKGNEVIQGGTAKDRDEVTANRQQNKDNIDMENKGSSSGNC